MTFGDRRRAMRPLRASAARAAAHRLRTRPPHPALRPTAQAQAAIHQQLIGTWLGGTGDVGLAYVFQPDGHYSSAGGTRNKMTGQLIPSFRNDGTFALNNNALVLIANDNSRSAQFFRIGRVSRDNGRNWNQQLCLLDPKNGGEVCYEKR